MKKILIVIAVLVLLFSGYAVVNSSVDKSNEDVSFSVSKSTTKENALSQHIESNISVNTVTAELDTINANTTSQKADATTVDVTAKKIVDKSVDKKAFESTTSKPVQTTKSTTQHTTTSKQPTTKKASQCSNNNNHSMKCGNMGRWFDSKSDVKAYVDSVMKSWADKWESGEISDDEYFANCPQGYECWICGYCGKWTGNFK